MDPNQKDNPESLETNSNETDALESAESPKQEEPKSQKQAEPVKPNQTRLSKFKNNPNRFGFFGRIFGFAKNYIYLTIFILIVIAAIISIVYVYEKNKTTPTSKVNTQSLNQATLSQLNSNDTQVGGTQQTLDIQSNTVFAGTVLVKNSLDIAGTLKIGGSLNLPGITVSGISNFDQVNASSIIINGSAQVKGTLTVSGGASFGGSVSVPQLNVSNLQLTGDIVISHHITTVEASPGDNGSNLGSGGTTTITGTDTAGTININTGSSPGSGCLANITFNQKYGSIPHVVISAANQAASTTQYYVNSSTTGFSICFNNPPGGGQSMAFAYISID